jgi:putative membrane protein
MFSSFGQFCNGFSSFGRFHSGGFIMMGIGLVLVLVVAYFIFKNDSFLKSDSSESPLELLKKRYVNGEINEDEYLSKKEILGKLK